MGVDGSSTGSADSIARLDRLGLVVVNWTDCGIWDRKVIDEHLTTNIQTDKTIQSTPHIYIYIMFFVLRICVRGSSTTEVHGGEMFGGIWSNAFVLVRFSH